MATFYSSQVVAYTTHNYGQPTVSAQSFNFYFLFSHQKQDEEERPGDNNAAQ
jgi:hypothetical protein